MDSFINTNEIKLPDPNFEYITTDDSAKKAMSALDRYQEHYIDTETTGLDPYKARWSLLQIGTVDKVFVFDVRYDTEHSSLHPEILDPILQDKNKLHVFQNAAFDMKIIKVNRGFYIENVYDTMLAEQLLNLGRNFVKASLDALVLRYIGVSMTKEPRNTFKEYDQKFEPFQLRYAANDVTVLPLIKDLQKFKLKKEELEEVAQLEFDFLIPLCEMELNGIKIDTDKWRTIMGDVKIERDKTKIVVQDILSQTEDQTMLFNVPTLNVDSHAQLKVALNKYGIDIKSTGADVLSNYEGIPVIDNILDYRKAEKLISTYSETLLNKISPVTGRLHTDFRQMVSTGRMSSSSPNLQNIPHGQKYRGCFIAEDGYSLITSDMSSAELRIIGNLSGDPIFKECFMDGIDLHTRSASEIYKVPMNKVDTIMRNACKALSFGLMYGLSKYGLSRRLKITEKEAKDLIENYFSVFKQVKKYLDESGKDGLLNGYSKSISGRKRYYNKPESNNPDKNKILASIKRQAMNMPIQSANSDTIKKSMVYCVERLKQGNYDARLLLSVHDEIVVEVKNEQKYEVAKLVKQSIIDGFGYYFSDIPMETIPLLSPCWTKDVCDCGYPEMKFVSDKKYGTKLVCIKCGKEQ